MVLRFENNWKWQTRTNFIYQWILKTTSVNFFGPSRLP